jgi:nucleotide-binding universal stress UspA family protein
MRVLVAVDGSPESERALEHAAEVATALGGTVALVHAVDPAVEVDGSGDEVRGLTDAERRLVVENVEDAEERGQRILDEAAELAAERGHDVTAALLYGDPVAAITDHAAETGVDAIYLGHRGRSERAGAMLGSVAKEVVGRATVPVTVVR